MLTTTSSANNVPFLYPTQHTPPVSPVILDLVRHTSNDSPPPPTLTPQIPAVAHHPAHRLLHRRHLRNQALQLQGLCDLGVVGGVQPFLFVLDALDVQGQAGAFEEGPQAVVERAGRRVAGAGGFVTGGGGGGAGGVWVRGVRAGCW